MAVTSGFFNAEYTGDIPDRSYNAEQFGELLDGIMEDGVFGSVGDAFNVTAGPDMSVYVGTGRAWFNNIWVKNSNLLNLEIGSSSATLGRYDAVVIDIDKSLEVRAGRILVVQGTAAASPVKPSMIHTENHNQYPLAYLHIRAGASSITSSDIEYVVGTNECPTASGILSGISIIQQTEATSLSSSDVFLLERSAGLRKVQAGNLLTLLANVLSPKNHRRLYRGKNLGSAFTSGQKTAIASGTFEDLFVGDYWTISGVKYRIVDIDYWYGVGDTPCQTHHVVVMPDTTLGNIKMRDSDTTDGAYHSSKPFETGMSSIQSEFIDSAFGSDYILKYRCLIENATSDGVPSNTEWYNIELALPSEIQMFGTRNMSAMSSRSGVANHKTVDKVQFALFDIDPSAIKSNHHCWLRDVVSGGEFAVVFSDGSSGRAGAHELYSMRPVFGITGGA